MTISDAESTACCPPLLAAPLSEDEATDLADILKALADPARLRLVSLIAAATDSEAFAFLARRLRYGNDTARLSADMSRHSASVRELSAHLLT